MLTLANDTVKIQIVFQPFSNENDFADAVQAVNNGVYNDPVFITFGSNESGQIELEGPDAVCEQVIDVLRYNGFIVIDSQNVENKLPKRRRTAAMRNLRKAA